MASRRNYLTIAELEEYADIDVLDDDEAFDQISQAEEIIDSYVGPQCRFLSSKRRVFGIATGGTSTTLVDTSNDSVITPNQDDYFAGCEVEIIGGTGAGQRRIISSQDDDSGTITVTAAWATTPDSTSAYRIYQLGKFPRREDGFYESTSEKWYKSIPEAVKRATAAQVQYMIDMGESFFSGQKPYMKREQISDYEYELGDNFAALSRLIAPKAKTLLRGIMNRKGTLNAE